MHLEVEISNALRRELCAEPDVKVVDLEDFEKNLVPGTLLSGLALGFEILLDRDELEKKIVEFLERLAEERYVPTNRYGSWNLSHHACVLLSIPRKRRVSWWRGSAETSSLTHRFTLRDHHSPST